MIGASLAPALVAPLDGAGALLPTIREKLLELSAASGAFGIPGTDANGHLFRPIVACAALSGAPEAAPPGFWHGVLAVQLAHEASLVHDDIVDEAGERRGEPTVVASKGVAAAIIRGDHLLTASYRSAARTGSLIFADLFARAVERTVAGEALQARSTGRRLTPEEYEEIALGKAGELVGCSLALVPILESWPTAPAIFELGRRIGLLYQRLDDLLDYCPHAGTGKPPLRDYEQSRWTWVLEEAPSLPFGLPSGEASARFHGGGEASPAARVLTRFEQDAADLSTSLEESLPNAGPLVVLVAGWVKSAREAVRREASAVPRPAPPSTSADTVRILLARIPQGAGADGYLAAHSRSFLFASRFLNPADAERVARVYSFCRMTDDLVDRPPPGVSVEALLEVWTDRARRAYDGERTEFPLLDRVMSEMSAASVPFDYAAELVEGMRMDLRGDRYGTLSDLRVYTYRVASVVGLWLTRLFGFHDPHILERAERMGHAMQLTNILRDVGEDLRRGRVYLPEALLSAHGVTEQDLTRMAAGGQISPGYRAITEELIRVAEADYEAAFDALRSLPPSFARPMMVAGHVYAGILTEIRRAGHDNLRRRAYTRPLTKARLAARALWGLRHSSARPGGAPAHVTLSDGG